MSSVVVYSKNNCPNCDRIKKVLEDNGVEFEYIKDDVKIMEVALELRNNNKLVEMNAPIIMVDGVQIKHTDVRAIV